MPDRLTDAHREVTSWADHANRITERERVIDGASYVPTIEALAVVADLQAMQGDGVVYEPVEQDGVYRWRPVAALSRGSMGLDIPIVVIHKSGKHRVVGAASTMEGAERLLRQLAAMYEPRGLTVYIDCSQSVADAKRDFAQT